MISVIVPVFNVESYLQECIDSILSQSYTDFELLLIDDGSTDSSYNICKEYESKDKRIRVYKKVNGGVSSARNLGIDNAKGEWVTFIDSDDYIGNEYLKKLVSIEKDSSCELSLVEGFIKHNTVKQFFTSTPKYVSLEIMIESICGKKGLCLAPWGKLFKKDIILKNNIRFTDRLSYCEDLIFCFEYFKYVNSNAFVCNDTSYFYREVSNSLTHKIVNYKQVFRAMELQLNNFIYYGTRFPENSIINEHFIAILLDSVLRIGEQVFYDESISKNEKKVYIGKCKKCIKCISKYHFNVELPYSQNIKLFIIKNLPYWFVKYFYLIK